MTNEIKTACGVGIHTACVKCGCPCHPKPVAWGQMGPEWKTAYAGA